MAPAKQEPSLMERLDQYVDRRAALEKRRVELKGELPRLRQAWNEAAATADPTDDLPAQRAFEQAEHEFKNVEAALIGIEQKIESTRHDIANAQRRAAVAQAKREASAMSEEADAMQKHFAAFLSHAKRLTASHNQVRRLIGAGDQLNPLARWVEVQLIEAGFPDLVYQRTMTLVHGPGVTPTEAAEAMVTLAETTN